MSNPPIYFNRFKVKLLGNTFENSAFLSPSVEGYRIASKSYNLLSKALFDVLIEFLNELSQSSNKLLFEEIVRLDNFTNQTPILIKLQSDKFVIQEQDFKEFSSLIDLLQRKLDQHLLSTNSTSISDHFEIKNVNSNNFSLFTIGGESSDLSIRLRELLLTPKGLAFLNKYSSNESDVNWKIFNFDGLQIGLNFKRTLDDSAFCKDFLKLLDF